MKLTQILIVLGSAALAVAKPVMHNPFKRANMTVMPTDTQVLQYALTLENLEATL
jgi:hypothetical protein